MPSNSTGGAPPEDDQTMSEPSNEAEEDSTNSLPWEFEVLLTVLTAWDREAALRVRAQRRQRDAGARAAEDLTASEQRNDEPDAMDTTGAG